MGISGGTKPETFGECTVPWAGSWRFIGSGVDHTGDGLVLTWNPLVLNKLVEMDTTRAEHLLSERLLRALSPLSACGRTHFRQDVVHRGYPPLTYHHRPITCHSVSTHRYNPRAPQRSLL